MITGEPKRELHYAFFFFFFILKTGANTKKKRPLLFTFCFFFYEGVSIPVSQENKKKMFRTGTSCLTHSTSACTSLVDCSNQYREGKARICRDAGRNKSTDFRGNQKKKKEYILHARKGREHKKEKTANSSSARKKKEKPYQPRAQKPSGTNQTGKKMQQQETKALRYRHRRQKGRKEGEGKMERLPQASLAPLN